MAGNLTGASGPGGVVVCVDAGTTLIKSVVFDATGRALSQAHAATEVHRPEPRQSEQDMDQVWRAVVTTVREAMAGVRRPVRAVALTAQGDGAWPVDAAGRPTRPAVLWNDGRAAALVERWRADGVLDEAFRLTASLGNAGQPHAVLRALAEREPEVVDRTHAVLSCGGWLFLRLTGVLGIDRSDASAPWLDVATGGYSAELMELYGLAGLTRLLPPLLEEGDRVQPLTTEAGAELGLPPGTPVVSAPYDIATTAIGSGATGVGDAVTVLGTTLCTETFVFAADPSAPPSGLTLDLGWGGVRLRAFPTLAGTGVIDWAAGLLGVTDAAGLCALAGAAPAGADGLLVLPYLSPAGERAPFLDTAARGAFTGLSFTHGPAHLARAVLEALAHVVRDCLDTAPPGVGELRVCGGGARDDLWCQVIADVTGCEVVRTRDSQVGAKGALVVAVTALGDHPGLAAAAAAVVTERDRRRPDPHVRELHEAGHRAFLAARADAAPGWRRNAAQERAARHVPVGDREPKNSPGAARV